MDSIVFRDFIILLVFLLIMIFYFSIVYYWLKHTDPTKLSKGTGTKEEVVFLEKMVWVFFIVFICTYLYFMVMCISPDILGVGHEDTRTYFMVIGIANIITIANLMYFLGYLWGLKVGKKR